MQDDPTRVEQEELAREQQAASAPVATVDIDFRPLRPAAARSFRKKRAPSRSPSPAPRDRVHNHPRNPSRSRSRSPDIILSGRSDADRRNDRRAERRSSGPSVDAVVQGRVTAVRDFGCFLRVAGCERDGLLHISQCSDSRIEVAAMRELFPVGSQHWVRVVSVDGGKVGLSRKGVQPPSGHGGQLAASASLPSGGVPELFSIHRGVVTNATDFAMCA